MVAVAIKLLYNSTLLCGFNVPIKGLSGPKCVILLIRCCFASQYSVTVAYVDCRSGYDVFDGVLYR